MIHNSFIYIESGGIFCVGGLIEYLVFESGFVLWIDKYNNPSKNYKHTNVELNRTLYRKFKNL